MPRRNQRREFDRLINDTLLGDDYRFTRDPVLSQQRADARRERARAVRMRSKQDHAADWSRCVVPGCDFNVLRELSNGIEFPICSLHAAAVWEHVELGFDSNADLTEARAALAARRDAIRADRIAANERDQEEWKADLKADRIRGTIYFVRAGGLIKVGWTVDLEQRLRTYGPHAELLATTPGYRADETALHRQLTPSRAKGREWYHDDDVLAAFVAEAVERHGRPRSPIRWTEPPRSKTKPSYYRG